MFRRPARAETGISHSFLADWSAGTGSRRGKGLSSGLNRGFPPWLEAGSFLHTGLNNWAHVTKQPQRPGTEACSPAPPSPGPARLSVSDTRADVAEKADIAMYEDDDERMEAAEQLPDSIPEPVPGPSGPSPVTRAPTMNSGLTRPGSWPGSTGVPLPRRSG